MDIKEENTFLALEFYWDPYGPWNSIDMGYYHDIEGKNKDEENETKFNKKADAYASQFTDWSSQITRHNAIGATQFSRARQEQQRSCPGSRSEHFLLRDWEDGQRCQ